MRLRLLLLVLTALLIVPAAAQAADSHAPHGARLDWLPRDEWVMSSWLPYDDSGLSPATIARRGGRTRAGARARIAALLKARGERAVRLGAMGRAQARALYAEQMASLPAFMSHTYRTPAQQVSFLCRPH
jgi:signal transduction histidine kinase